MKQTRFGIFVVVFASAAGLAMLPSSMVGQNKKGAHDSWKKLFNGKDLTGWDTWLGVPVDAKEPVGLNKDPKKVFTVVNADGKPAVRVSGEIYGALTSKRPYQNFHFKLEFKWGEKRWPPRANTIRDSGLLYHCVGKHGVTGRRAWMRSQECQIQEGDCGDYWSVAGAIVDVEGVTPKGKTKPIRYQKGGKKYKVPTKQTGSRIIKSVTNEKPRGQWNTIEVYTVGQTSVHVVNGKVVMILTGSRQIVNGQEAPLVGGKLQIQSEGAEVFYRGMAIRSIDELPKKLLQ